MRSTPRHSTRIFGSLALVVVLAIATAEAAVAACSTDGASPQKVSDFLSNPSALLGGPAGQRSGGEVTADIRNLLVSDPATLSVVIGLLKTDPLPSPDLQRAIGAGLGLAAMSCLRPDPTFAGEIQAQLAATNSQDAKREYAAVTGNQLIGAIGGGAGGLSGGASGGQTTPLSNLTSNSSSFQAFVSNSLANTPTNYFTGGTTSSSAASSAAASSVSR